MDSRKRLLASSAENDFQKNFLSACRAALATNASAQSDKIDLRVIGERQALLKLVFAPTFGGGESNRASVYCDLTTSNNDFRRTFVLLIGDLMNVPKMKLLAAATLLSSLAIAAPCQAGMIGWFDYVHVDTFDTAYGWVCENEDPTNTPSYGSLDIYLDGPIGTGTFYYNAGLTGSDWGDYKAGVNAAGYCGSDSYVGFDLSGYFWNYPSTTVYIYWKDASTGVRTLLGGSPKNVTGYGDNY